MFSVEFASRHILAWNFEMALRFVENLFALGYKHQLITDVHKKYDSSLIVLYGTHKYSSGKRATPFYFTNISINYLLILLTF